MKTSIYYYIYKGQGMLIKKQMTLAGVVSIGIGAMLGAGIFALLGQVVLQAGDKTYITFLFAGLVAMLAGYSYARLAALYPQSGGITDYFNHAFDNRFWAGLFSLIYLSTLCISIAMLGRSLGIYATALFGVSPETGPLFSVAAIVLLGVLNIKGADEVGKAEVVLVALKLSVLVVLAIMAFYQYFYGVRPPIIVHIAEPLGFWKAVSFAFFAYAGFGVMTNAAGDVNNPRRMIPLAIYIAIAMVLVLYISLAFVVLNYVPLSALLSDVDTAIAVASKQIMGPYGFIIISVAALLALLSGINAMFFSSFKIMSSMVETRELPTMLNKHLTPKSTIGMLMIILSMAFASFYLEFQFIATLASSAFLVSYLALFMAHLKLYKQTNSPRIIIVCGLVSMAIIFVQSLLH